MNKARTKESISNDPVTTATATDLGEEIANEKGHQQPTKVNIKLLLFAKARELIGLQSTTITVSAQLSGAELIHQIVSHFPQLQQLSKCSVISVNQEYCEGHSLLHLRNGDEVAFIPPISGG